MHIRIASASLALIWSSTAMAADPDALQPSRNWDVDYGVTQCTAARSFGNASAPIILGIVPSLSGETYKLLVSVPRPGPEFAQESAATVEIGQRRIPTEALYYGGKGVPMSVYQLVVSAADLEQASSAPMIGVHAAGGANYAFALSDMPALLAGLRNCTADLRQYWNADERNIAVPASSGATDVRSLLTTADYPTEALRRESEGFARASDAKYQLLIDEKGAVAGCDVVTSSGAPALDVTFCDVAKERVRFAPAKDGRGLAIRSVVTTPMISWSNQNILNTGCMWVTGTAVGVLNTCASPGPIKVLEPPVASSPPTSPAPPKSTK